MGDFYPGINEPLKPLKLPMTEHQYYDSNVPAFRRDDPSEEGQLWLDTKVNFLNEIMKFLPRSTTNSLTKQELSKDNIKDYSKRTDVAESVYNTDIFEDQDIGLWKGNQSTVLDKLFSTTGNSTTDFSRFAGLLGLPFDGHIGLGTYIVNDEENNSRPITFMEETADGKGTGIYYMEYTNKKGVKVSFDVTTADANYLIPVLKDLKGDTYAKNFREGVNFHATVLDFQNTNASYDNDAKQFVVDANGDGYADGGEDINGDGKIEYDSLSTTALNTNLYQSEYLKDLGVYSPVLDYSDVFSDFMSGSLFNTDSINQTYTDADRKTYDKLQIALGDKETAGEFKIFMEKIKFEISKVDGEGVATASTTTENTLDYIPNIFELARKGIDFSELNTNGTKKWDDKDIFYMSMLMIESKRRYTYAMSSIFGVNNAKPDVKDVLTKYTDPDLWQCDPAEDYLYIDVCTGTGRYERMYNYFIPMDVGQNITDPTLQKIEKLNWLNKRSIEYLTNEAVYTMYQDAMNVSITDNKSSLLGLKITATDASASVTNFNNMLDKTNSIIASGGKLNETQLAQLLSLAKESKDWLLDEIGKNFTTVSPPVNASALTTFLTEFQTSKDLTSKVNAGPLVSFRNDHSTTYSFDESTGILTFIGTTKTQHECDDLKLVFSSPEDTAKINAFFAQNTSLTLQIGVEKAKIDAFITVNPKFAYERLTGTLTVIGEMKSTEYTDLRKIFTSSADALILNSLMSSSVERKNKFVYESSTGKLTVNGTMTTAECDTLKSFFQTTDASNIESLLSRSLEKIAVTTGTYIGQVQDGSPYVKEDGSKIYYVKDDATSVEAKKWKDINDYIAKINDYAGSVFALKDKSGSMTFIEDYLSNSTDISSSTLYKKGTDNTLVEDTALKTSVINNSIETMSYYFKNYSSYTNKSQAVAEMEKVIDLSFDIKNNTGDVFSVLSDTVNRQAKIFNDINNIDKFHYINYGTVRNVAGGVDGAGKTINNNLYDKGILDLGYYPEEIARTTAQSPYMNPNQVAEGDSVVDGTGNARYQTNMVDKMYFSMIAEMQKMNNFYMMQMFASPIEISKTLTTGITIAGLTAFLTNNPKYAYDSTTGKLTLNGEMTQAECDDLKEIFDTAGDMSKIDELMNKFVTTLTSGVTGAKLTTFLTTYPKYAYNSTTGTLTLNGEMMQDEYDALNLIFTTTADKNKIYEIKNKSVAGKYNFMDPLKASSNALVNDENAYLQSKSLFVSGDTTKGLLTIGTVSENTLADSMDEIAKVIYKDLALKLAAPLTTPPPERPGVFRSGVTDMNADKEETYYIATVPPATMTLSSPYDVLSEKLMNWLSQKKAGDEVTLNNFQGMISIYSTQILFAELKTKNIIDSNGYILDNDGVRIMNGDTDASTRITALATKLGTLSPLFKMDFPLAVPSTTSASIISQGLNDIVIGKDYVFSADSIEQGIAASKRKEVSNIVAGAVEEDYTQIKTFVGSLYARMSSIDFQDAGASGANNALLLANEDDPTKAKFSALDFTNTNKIPTWMSAFGEGSILTSDIGNPIFKAILENEGIITQQKNIDGSFVADTYSILQGIDPKVSLASFEVLIREGYTDSSTGVKTSFSRGEINTLITKVNDALLGTELTSWLKGEIGNASKPGVKNIEYTAFDSKLKVNTYDTMLSMFVSRDFVTTISDIKKYNESNGFALVNEGSYLTNANLDNLLARVTENAKPKLQENQFQSMFTDDDRNNIWNQLISNGYVVWNPPVLVSPATATTSAIWTSGYYGPKADLNGVDLGSGLSFYNNAVLGVLNTNSRLTATNFATPAIKEALSTEIYTQLQSQKYIREINGEGYLLDASVQSATIMGRAINLSGYATNSVLSKENVIAYENFDLNFLQELANKWGITESLVYNNPVKSLEMLVNAVNTSNSFTTKASSDFVSFYGKMVETLNSKESFNFGNASFNTLMSDANYLNNFEVTFKRGYFLWVNPDDNSETSLAAKDGWTQTTVNCTPNPGSLSAHNSISGTTLRIAHENYPAIPEGAIEAYRDVVSSLKATPSLSNNFITPWVGYNGTSNVEISALLQGDLAGFASSWFLTGNPRVTVAQEFDRDFVEKNDNYADISDFNGDKLADSELTLVDALRQLEIRMGMDQSYIDMQLDRFNSYATQVKDMLQIGGTGAATEKGANSLEQLFKNEFYMKDKFDPLILGAEFQSRYVEDALVSSNGNIASNADAISMTNTVGWYETAGRIALNSTDTTVNNKIDFSKFSYAIDNDYNTQYATVKAKMSSMKFDGSQGRDNIRSTMERASRDDFGRTLVMNDLVLSTSASNVASFKGGDSSPDVQVRIYSKDGTGVKLADYPFFEVLQGLGVISYDTKIDANREIIDNLVTIKTSVMNTKTYEDLYNMRGPLGLDETQLRQMFDFLSNIGWNNVAIGANLSTAHSIVELNSIYMEVILARIMISVTNDELNTEYERRKEDYDEQIGKKKDDEVSEQIADSKRSAFKSYLKSISRKK
jgi:hypothetical protein